MGRADKDSDVMDLADGTEDPPLNSWIAEAALDRWELMDRHQGKRRRPRESGDSRYQR